MVPSIITNLKQYFETLNSKIDLQNQEIAILHSNINIHKKLHQVIGITDNRLLKKEFSEAKDQIYA